MEKALEFAIDKDVITLKKKLSIWYANRGIINANEAVNQVSVVNQLSKFYQEYKDYINYSSIYPYKRF